MGGSAKYSTTDPNMNTAMVEEFGCTCMEAKS